MKILVTGGLGFIGSHSCVELLQADMEVIIFDNLSNSQKETVSKIEEITGKSIEFYQKDLLDIEAIRKVFKNHDIDGVIHFAGKKAVGESVQLPLEYYQNNIIGTLNLCQVMKEFDCKKLVFSSSATVYGMARTNPIKEDFPLSTTNPYGTTKLMIEQILRDIAYADESWSIALLRYFNPIGSHPSGLIGEKPNGIPNNLIPYIAQVATGERDKLHIFGDDYPTHDGTGVRDYIHVMDLAIGHIYALDKIMKQTGIEAYNLGTGIGYSVLDLVHTFERVTGTSVPYVIDERRSGDIATCYADPTKAERELGWKSRYSIEDMCKDTWNYFKNQKKTVM